jgi:hypothetical protein
MVYQFTKPHKALITNTKSLKWIHGDLWERLSPFIICFKNHILCFCLKIGTLDLLMWVLLCGVRMKKLDEREHFNISNDMKKY